VRSGERPLAPLLAEAFFRGVRLVEKFDGMGDPRTQAPASPSGSELKDAARIAGRDDIGVCRSEGRDLALEHGPCHGAMGERIDPCGAAATRGVVVVDELEARNLPQETAGRLFHPLSVDEMTGVVVTHAHGAWAAALRHRRSEPCGIEQFAHVANGVGEGRALIAQPFACFPQGCTTARGVHDQCIDLCSAERGGIPARETLREVRVPRMGMERSAARLIARHDDIEAVAREHARRGVIYPTKEFRHNASDEQRNASAARALRRHESRQGTPIAMRGNARCERGELAQGGRQKTHRKPVEAKPLHDRQAVDRAAQASGVGHKTPQGEGFDAFGEPATQSGLLDLAAHRLEHAPVAHPGRAGGLTRAAAKAQVHLLRHARAERNPSLGDTPHEVHTTAWRRLLSPRLAVGRTNGQA